YLVFAGVWFVTQVVKQLAMPNSTSRDEKFVTEARRIFMLLNNSIARLDENRTSSSNLPYQFCWNLSTLCNYPTN
ncbi:6069_t:CDS:1, partial [Acaulospora morrowiae]